MLKKSSLGSIHDDDDDDVNKSRLKIPDFSILHIKFHSISYFSFFLYNKFETNDFILRIFAKFIT